MWTQLDFCLLVSGEVRLSYACARTKNSTEYLRNSLDTNKAVGDIFTITYCSSMYCMLSLKLFSSASMTKLPTAYVCELSFQIIKSVGRSNLLDNTVCAMSQYFNVDYYFF